MAKKRGQGTTVRYGALALGAWLLMRTAVRLQRSLSWSFRGKTALITGGSRGLGLLIAQELERRGCNVALMARDADELARAARRFRDAARVLTIEGDVCAPSDLHEAVRATRARFGDIDVLVNNAGVIEVGPLDAMKMEDYEHAMGVHFWAPLRLVREVVPDMRRRGGGRIVNISSIGGVVSVPHLLPYSASKFALTGFSEGITSELAHHGIRVTTVIPGLMRTASPLHARFKGQHEREFAWFSISDSLPVVSINARRAARAIVRAAGEGRPRLVLSLPAHLAVFAKGVVPGLVAQSLALMSRLLPAPGGIGAMALPGYRSRSSASPSWLTALSDGKAGEYNER